MVFIFRGQNYLLKMVDDSSFVSSCQAPGLSFSTGNDPFILRPLRSPAPEYADKLQVEESLQPRILGCLDVLAREKADEFRYKLAGATLVDRNDRMGQIKSIYQARDSRKPKLNLEQMERDRSNNSFDEDDEFDGLVRRYEKEVLLAIKNKLRRERKQSALQSEPRATRSPRPQAQSQQRLKVLRDDVTALAEIRKESLEVKERLESTFKARREKPHIKLIDEKEPILLEQHSQELSRKLPQNSQSQPRLVKQAMAKEFLRDIRREKKSKKKDDVSNASSDKGFIATAEKPEKPERPERPAKPARPEKPVPEEKKTFTPLNLDIWRSYSSVV